MPPGERATSDTETNLADELLLRLPTAQLNVVGAYTDVKPSEIKSLESGFLYRFDLTQTIIRPSHSRVTAP